MAKRIEIDKWVYKFTDPTVMKFQPKEDYFQPQQKINTSFASRIRNFFSPPSRAVKTTKPQLRRQLSFASEQRIYSKPNIKFVRRLTNEHVLIGNQDQLDVTNIGGIVSEFVDTEYLWSLNIKKAIYKVSIDFKKNYLVLLAEKEVQVFLFDPKAIHEKPTKVCETKLKENYLHLHVVREGTFVVCDGKGIEVYAIDEVKGIRLTCQKRYELPNSSIKLFQIPQPYENILNVFFQESISTTNTSFGLWSIQIQFFEKEIKVGRALKVYDVPGYLRSFTKLQNYSKSIYLLNLGKEIYAIRRGYVLDFANVDIKSGYNQLKYLSNNKLIHVSDTKVEVYRFSINEEVHPPRIIVSSTDSIQIPTMATNYQFVEAVELLSDNFAVFYQVNPAENKLLHGQTKYAFIITHQIKMEDKLRNILPRQIQHQQIQNIQEKADMAKKMGMERKEIYLRLWNNSNKNSVQDFKILLDTLDYDTIKAEIQKKLKKSSMNYRQVHLLEQGCMSMLHLNVFGLNNTKEDIKNYLISNLLIRKFELYKQITIAQKNEGKAIAQDPTGRLLINIQNYNNYKTMDIKSMLFQLIHRFCNEDKNQVTKIRILIKHFKFSLRIVYQQILAEIVKVTKKKFLKLLEFIPELLPFEHDKDDMELQNIALMQGIWKDITEEQWEKGLFIDTVATIDNRENLNQVCTSVWYKRYWLTQHDFINLSKAEIQAIQDLNNSEHSFYEVIQKLFENIKQYTPLRQVIDFIQDTYEKMPQHIYGKVFLYRKLFDTFKENRHISKIDEIDNFAQFLKLKDQDIFKAMFNYEKVKKGFILKEMKPLYQKLSGLQVFNEGLLNYFASPKSEISDIKYLLNRMNNEKKQFHQQNGGIYEVLVRGMQLKLRLGSELDIPIDEVLIYIENIPFQHQPTIQRDLQIMKLINEQSARFKKIKLNMSIFDMTKNIDNVIAALIHYEIADTKIRSVRDIDKAKEITYRIISDVQNIKKKIYSDEEYQLLTIFTYLTQILQQVEMIPIVTLLLEDEWINNTFQISQVMIQNLILYNYKWKLNSNPSYSESSFYLKELVNLLPASNAVREYIEGEIEMAEILSSDNFVVRYPLSGGSDYFTSRQLQSIIINSPGDHLLKINVERLYQCAVKVQEIGSDKQLSEITLHGIYQMIILRLIQCEMLRQVVPLIKNLIQIQKFATYNFIYPSLLVAKIAPEMIQENRNLLLKCSSYLFKDPLRLLDLLQKMMSIKATSQEYKAVILNFYKQVKKDNVTFSEDCPLFESLMVKLLKENPELKKNFVLMLRYSLYNLLSHKQEFSRHPQFYIMFTILINQPYILVKYFYYNRYIINIKDLRCYFSFLIKDDLFSKPKALQFLKRLFLIIYEAVSKNRNIQDVADQYKRIPLTQIKEGVKITNPRNQFQQKLGKSLDRLKQKVKVVSHIELTRKKSIIQNDEVKLNRFKQRLQNPRTKQGIFQYPFLDSDDSPKNQDEKLKRKDKHMIQILEPFDQKFQRETLLKRTGKDIGQYVSVAKQKNHKLLYYSQKFSKDGIFGSLTIDRNTQNKIANAFENAILNNVRQSRNGKKVKLGKVHSQYFKPSEPLYEQQQQQGKRSRSKAIEVITQQERLVIQKQQQQVIKTPVISEIGHIPEEMGFLLKIIPLGTQINQQTVINFQPLDHYKDSENFVLFLRELIKIAFNREDLSLRGSLLFIKSVCTRYSKVGINKEWIQIYLRAQGLQNKFKLDLPLRHIFTAEGLFVDSEIVDNLFHFLLPSIIANLNDTNLMKLSKVIILAFKKSELEKQILLYYLLQLFNLYELALYNPELHEKDLKMQVEKIKMIINKIPTKYLTEKDDQLMKVFSEEEVRREIATLFINSMRNRYDMKAADWFAEKYILKTKRMTKKPGGEEV